MKHVSAIGLALAALLWAMPSQALANRLKLNSYQLEPTQFVIELEGTEGLVEPWVRVAGSTARVWFSGIETVSRFEQGEAEAPIKSLTLRPSAAKTGLLRLELMPDRTLTQRDVVITRNGTHATIRIALPTAAAAEPAAAATLTNVKPASTSAETAATAGSVAPDAPAAPAAVQAAPQVELPRVAPEPVFKQPEASTAAPRAELPQASQKKAEPKLQEPTSQLSTVQMLLLLTVLLGAIYGVLRLKLRKGGTASIPTEIQVLGNKRLGARHQLLIVRALGQDHLISVNGGHTERIASSEALHRLPVVASGALKSDAAMPAEQPKSRLGLGLGSALRAVRGHELFATAEAQRTADASRTPAGDTPFGAELLDFVRTSETRSSGLSESEAIAGLVRLRNRSS